MTTQEQYIERLKELVIQKFGRTLSCVEDCIALSDELYEKTGKRVSSLAVEQLFCMSHSDAPRPFTISAFAQYLGYGSWSDFCTSRDVKPAEDIEKIPVIRRWGVIILTAAAIALVIVTAIVLLRSNSTQTDNNSNATESIDSRFSSVREEWIAATTEHCNTIREYYTTANIEKFIAYVDEVNSRYVELAKDSIYHDITRYAVEHNITIDDATIAATAEKIIATCREMCDNIIIECSDIE